METKVCTKCKIEKTFDEYYKKKGCSNDLNSYCKKCHLELKQKFRKENPEKYKEQSKVYYEKTKLIQNEKKKIWIKNNREKYNSYWTKRKKEDTKFNLITKFRSRISSFLKKNGYSKKYKTIELIGCTPQELKEHLEKQFRDGMTWENRNLWHIDHIIPLSSAKTEEELYKLCHYTNLQPLCAEENLKKSNKIVEQIKNEE